MIRMAVDIALKKLNLDIYQNYDYVDYQSDYEAAYSEECSIWNDKL